MEPNDPGREAFRAAKLLRLKDPAYPAEVLMGQAPRSPDWREFGELAQADVLDVVQLRRIFTANQLRMQLRKDGRGTE